mmetsp:Transcript_7739/g.11424  ORF Transcript_7739/g.11424 Transcript_7739/m.11424 type:complete len:106 (+) Transcript_7739:275-592(+)
MQTVLILRNMNSLRSASSVFGRLSINSIATRGTLVSTRSMSEEQGQGSLYSKDIAFKPAEGGWGHGSKYNENFDRIFGKKIEIDKNKGDEESAANESININGNEV